MPIYAEKIKDKEGNLIDKLVDGKKQYYIRTYVEDEFGNRKQITRHNKEWLGRDGYWEAQREENRLKQELFQKQSDITLNQLFNEYIQSFKIRVKQSTLRKALDTYNIHIKPFFQNGEKKLKT